MADAPSRVERVLNLLALLLDTRRPLSREEIVREISGYPPEVSAHRRAFERDKEMLRGMGVPITVVALPGETSEVGYLVQPEEYYLPDLQLGADETAALRVAVNAISLGSLSAEGALMKLGELHGEAEAPIASLPLVPSLATLFEAFRRRAPVTFEYRGEERTVEPWGLTSKRGHWYMVGFDHGREAVRSFRADRVAGEVSVGEPGTFDAPADFRPDDHVEDRPWLFGDGEPVIVDVLVDAGHVEGAVAALGSDATVQPQPDGGAVVHVPVLDRAAFRQVVLDLLEHGEVLAPQDVRDDVETWIEHVAAHHRKRVRAR
jgi:predicted DNA-binding transcriptional regulator YafY